MYQYELSFVTYNFKQKSVNSENNESNEDECEVGCSIEKSVVAADEVVDDASEDRCEHVCADVDCGSGGSAESGVLEEYTGYLVVLKKTPEYIQPIPLNRSPSLHRHQMIHILLNRTLFLHLIQTLPLIPSIRIRGRMNHRPLPHIPHPVHRRQHTVYHKHQQHAHTQKHHQPEVPRPICSRVAHATRCFDALFFEALRLFLVDDVKVSA